MLHVNSRIINAVFEAMIDAGIGESQMSNVLVELNIPSLHHKSLKEREREIGSTIESVAERSCEKAIHEELSAIDILNSER